MREEVNGDFGLTLEVLIHAWADRTLSGRGFGVVGHSEGWGWDTRPEAASLAALIKVGETRKGSYSFAYLPRHEFGPTLVMRRDLGSDRSGRPGRVVTEVLVGSGWHLDAGHALATVVARNADIDWPMDATPTPNLPAVKASAVAKNLPTAGAIASVLMALSDQREDSGTPTLSIDEMISASAWLPTSLTRHLLIASRNDPLAAQALLTVDAGAGADEDGKSSRGANSHQVAKWKPFAERLLQVGNSPPDDIDTVDRLVTWVDRQELSTRAVHALNTSDLVALLLDADGSSSGESRRSEIIDEFVSRDIAGKTPAAIVEDVRYRAPRGIFESVQDAVWARSSESVAALSAAHRWGVSVDELSSKAFEILGRGFRDRTLSAADQRELEQFLQAYAADLAPEQLREVVADRWAYRRLTERWGKGSERLASLFWLSDSPVRVDLAAANAELLHWHPSEVGELVRSAPASRRRIEAAVRALPAGSISENAAVLSEILGGRPNRRAEASVATETWSDLSSSAASPSMYNRIEVHPRPNPAGVRVMTGLLVLLVVLAIVLVFMSASAGSGIVGWLALATVVLAAGCSLLLVSSHRRRARRSDAFGYRR